jgi:hypothetical protein
MLFLVIEAGQLIALQSLLSLLEPTRRRAALKRLVQNHGNALANLRSGDRRRPFFPRSVSRTRNHVASNESV